MTAYEFKRKLYKDYFEYLRSLEGIEHDDSEYEWYFDEYINSDTIKWINLISSNLKDGDIFSGFVIIGRSGPDKYPGSDYSIMEAYVDKKYRGEHLCQSAVEEYLSNHPGIWSLVVMKQNRGAEDYWDNIFVKRNNYSKFIFNETDDTKVIGYSV